MLPPCVSSKHPYAETGATQEALTGESLRRKTPLYLKLTLAETEA